MDNAIILIVSLMICWIVFVNTYATSLDDAIVIHISEDMIVDPTTTTTTILSIPTEAILHETHPRLLFNDISDCVGFDKQSSTPWSTYKSSIESSALVNYVAMDYLLNANQADLDNVTNTLLASDYTSMVSGTYVSHCKRLIRECLAYDYIQANLSEINDTNIRISLGNSIALAYDKMDDAPGSAFRFVDEIAPCYPALHVCGEALYNYTNASLASTPADWRATGTTDMYVNDSIHPTLCPYGAMECGTWEDGSDGLGGGYKNYYTMNIITSMYVFNFVNQTNITSVYNTAYKWITAPIWQMFPNGYEPSWITTAHTKHGYINALFGLVFNENRSYLYDLYERSAADNKLPNTRTWNDVDTTLLFCTRPNMTDVARTNPSWTSLLDKPAPYNIFRDSWNESSDWLALSAYNETTQSNRNEEFAVQLAFDYYGKGDNIFADSGEVKGVTAWTSYGPAGAYGHNILGYGNSTDRVAAGVCRTLDLGTLDTPANRRNYMMDDTFEFVEADMVVTQTQRADASQYDIGGNHTVANEKTTVLQDKLKHTRMILSPEGGFIVIDRVNNTLTRVMEQILHLNSFLADGISVSDNLAANVSGNLTIEGTSIDWKGQTWAEKVIITEGSEFTWNTSGMYNGQVTTQGYILPTGNMSVRRFWIRTGGYDNSAEINHPVLASSNLSTGNYTGIMGFNTREDTDEDWIYTMENVVTASGEAMSVTNGTFKYTVSNTDGVLGTFADSSTDAQVGFIYNTSITDIDYLWAWNVSVYNWTDNEIMTTNHTVDYAYINRINNTNTTWLIKAVGVTNVTLGGLESNTWKAYYVNGTEIAVADDSTQISFNINTDGIVSGFITGTPIVVLSVESGITFDRITMDGVRYNA